MKNVVILGSTGSIGTQSLEVIEEKEGFSVLAISGNSNIKLLENQARKFKPKFVAVPDEKKASELRIKLKDENTKILSGKESLEEIAALPEADTVITGIVGIAGLLPTMSAVNAGKRIGLANKETLVTAGDIVMETAKKTGAEIIPVDSEHSAIFQCMAARVNDKDYDKELKRILLTASGGPFFGKTKDELSNITKKEALKHPNWTMGAKITIDSATLMNKGLEVLEAKSLFGVSLSKVDVLVHRQSIVHSMVEFSDNAIIAQLGVPDMKVPIQYALTYPKRLSMSDNTLDLTKYTLTFDEPDKETFKCLELAYRAGEIGGTMTTVLNGANEAAVGLFLEDKIKFLDIANIVEMAMDNHKTIKNPTVCDILETDRWAREYVNTNLHRLK